MVCSRAIKGMIFFAVFTVLIGLTLDSNVALGQGTAVDQMCTGGEIPCTKRCGPAVINSYKSGSKNIVIMGERSEINLLSGKSTEYGAQCQTGFVAVGGGYKIVNEGTTIDLDEIMITGNWAENNPQTHWNGWKVSVKRDNSDAPNNCLSLEVHSTCVQAN